LENSLNTTNGDRILKLNLFLQNNLRNYLITMKGVEDARVYYIPVDSSNRLLAEAQETNASVLLTVNDEFEPPTAETIAEVVASAIGNSTTDKIRVADQNGNLLFGGERDLYTSRARSTEEYNELLRNNFINNIYMLLIKRGYDDVEIAPHLDIDNTKVTQLFTEYFPAEGQDQGVYKHSYTYKSENAGSTGGGIPGTSSNDETDYMIEDSSSSEGSVEIEEYDYLPNERVTNTEYETGVINVVNSSVGLVLRKYRTYKEEELERAGLLEEMTFEEYIDANNEDMALEVEEDVYTLVSFASGISRDKIHITAIEKPVFVPKVVKVRTFTDYLQYILAALIIGLIVFVVIKAFRPIEVTELEPELSVEQLLATTKEGQEIEEIDFEEVSEVRRLIEKFVDEKPEAVAQLLRNWLNEDWG
jgi:flagellar M-ring protein FliF